MDLEKKQPQESGHLKKWVETRYSLRETGCGATRTRRFQLVVEDIRKAGQAWQEIKNKKHRKTDEVEYSCPYKT